MYIQNLSYLHGSFPDFETLWILNCFFLCFCVVCFVYLDYRWMFWRGYQKWNCGVFIWPDNVINLNYISNPSNKRWVELDFLFRFQLGWIFEKSKNSGQFTYWQFFFRNRDTTQLHLTLIFRLLLFRLLLKLRIFDICKKY